MLPLLLFQYDTLKKSILGYFVKYPYPLFCGKELCSCHYNVSAAILQMFTTVIMAFSMLCTGQNS